VILFIGGIAVLQCLSWLAPLIIRMISLIMIGADVKLQHRAVVMVGGDFARSPRMQYHAVSLTQSRLFDVVSLVGIDEGNNLCEGLASTPNCTVDVGGLLALGRSGFLTSLVGAVEQYCPVRPLRWVVITAFRIITFILLFGLELRRVLTISVVAVRGHGRPAAGCVTIPCLVLCQTPPAVPFVILVKCVRAAVYVGIYVPLQWVVLPITGVLLGLTPGSTGSRRRREASLQTLCRSIKMCTAMQVMVDWHNFGFTLLEVDRRPTWVVQTYKFLEKHLCGGDVNLTVSKAMQRALSSAEGNTRIGPFRLVHPVHVLYDSAPSFFAPVSRQRAIQQLQLSKSGSAVSNAPQWFWNEASSTDCTGGVKRSGLVIVSSTSWGSDDDYSMVVDALRKLDACLMDPAVDLATRNVWLVVTGKGPTRKRFEEDVAAAGLSSAIVVSTVYFQSFIDYSTMLGAADVGLSVHFSSSGLDLPMKCVDMLGAGLPVAAVSYECIEELVTSESGWLFRDAETLYSLLRSFLCQSGNEALMRKAQFVQEHRERWEQSWDRVVKPLLISSHSQQ
jgi:beta-1,4-mannosyltransferase